MKHHLLLVSVGQDTSSEMRGRASVAPDRKTRSRMSGNPASAPAAAAAATSPAAEGTVAWRGRRRRRRQRPQERRQRPVSAALLVVAVAVALVVSLPEAGASRRSRVPWWYPSRENWGLPSADGDVGGEGGGGGGSWPGLGFPRLLYREEARLAGEFVATSVASGLAEQEEEGGDEGLGEMIPVCHAHEATNHTLRKLGASVDRCSSPHFTLSEIHPSQLVYAEVDPTVEAAKQQKDREQEEARWKRKKEENQKASTGRGQGEGLDSGQDGEDGKENETDFLGIFLFLKGDFFSVELENALTAVLPAYPRARVVKADAPSFLSFCVQYDLHTFPQLLLFRNGHLMSRYRGKRSPEGLASWFSLMTGTLPKAVPRRPLPPPPPPHPLSPPGLDEPLTWLALLYAAAKITTAIGWYLKRRRRRGAGAGAGGPGDGGGGGRGAAAAAMGARFRRWLMRVLFRSRRGAAAG